MHPDKLILSTRSQTQQTVLHLQNSSRSVSAHKSHYFNQQEEKNTLRGQYVSMDMNMIIT